MPAIPIPGTDDEDGDIPPVSEPSGQAESADHVRDHRIDRYVLGRALGRGGFGVVYRARDEVAGVEVVLKFLPPDIRKSPDELERIRTNYGLVSRLRHPFIANTNHLHQAESVDPVVRTTLNVEKGDYFLVMDFAPGKTLSRWRKDFPGGKVPWVDVLPVAQKIAEALDYAHSEGVVHRDVKPSNVIISERLHTVKVLDFGLAAEIHSSVSRMSGEVRKTSGTPPYMSPEQWAGDPQSGASDQYSLAVLVYEMVSGAVPFASVFESGSTEVIRETVRREPARPLPELSPARNRALLRALAKEPRARHRSCRDLVHALGRARPRWGGLYATAAPLAAVLGLVGLAVVVAWPWYAERRYDDLERATGAGLVAHRNLRLVRRPFRDCPAAGIPGKLTQAEQTFRGAEGLRLSGAYADAEVAYREAWKLCAEVRQELGTIERTIDELEQSAVQLGEPLRTAVQKLCREAREALQAGHLATALELAEKAQQVRERQDACAAAGKADRDLVQAKDTQDREAGVAAGKWAELAPEASRAIEALEAEARKATAALEFEAVIRAREQALELLPTRRTEAVAGALAKAREALGGGQWEEAKRCAALVARLAGNGEAKEAEAIVECAEAAAETQDSVAEQVADLRRQSQDVPARVGKDLATRLDEATGRLAKALDGFRQAEAAVGRQGVEAARSGLAEAGSALADYREKRNAFQSKLKPCEERLSGFGDDRPSAATDAVAEAKAKAGAAEWEDADTQLDKATHAMDEALGPLRNESRTADAEWHRKLDDFQAWLKGLGSSAEALAGRLNGAAATAAAEHERQPEPTTPADFREQAGADRQRGADLAAVRQTGTTCLDAHAGAVKERDRVQEKWRGQRSQASKDRQAKVNQGLVDADRLISDADRGLDLAGYAQVRTTLKAIEAEIGETGHDQDQAGTVPGEPEKPGAPDQAGLPEQGRTAVALHSGPPLPPEVRDALDKAEAAIRRVLEEGQRGTGTTNPLGSLATLFTVAKEAACEAPDTVDWLTLEREVQRMGARLPDLLLEKFGEDWREQLKKVHAMAGQLDTWRGVEAKVAGMVSDASLGDEKARLSAAAGLLKGQMALGAVNVYLGEGDTPAQRKLRELGDRLRALSSPAP